MPQNAYDDLLPRAAGGPPGNPYDAILQQDDAGQAVTLRQSMTTAADTAPDQAAEALTIAKQYKVPPDLAAAAFQRLKKQQAVDRNPYDAIVRQTPTLAETLTDPTTAAAVKDDLEPLGFLEWLTKGPSRAYRQGEASTDYAMLRGASLLRPLTATEQQRLDAAHAEMQAGGALGTEGSWFRGAITGAASNLPMLFGATLQGFKRGTESGVAAGLAGVALGPGAPVGVPALFTGGFSAGMLAGEGEYNFQLAAGLAYDDYRTITDELGRPIDPTVAKAAALATGALNASVFTFGLNAVLRTVPGLASLGTGPVQATVKAALRSPTTRAALADAMKGYVGSLTSATAAMVAARMVQILGGEAAKAIAPGDFAHRTPSDVGADLFKTGADALQSFALLSAPGPFAGLARDVMRAHDAQQNATFFTALGEGVAQSKTAERLPDQLQAFLHQATKDGPVETVYAPVDTWATYWQSKGIDPETVATAVTGNPQAYADARATQTDLAIPTARYATQLAATEHNAFFRNELRLAPEQMNAREAKVFTDALSEQEVSHEVTPATPDSAALVRDAVLAQLETAGVPRSVAESYATLYEHAFRTLGARADADPLTLFNRYGLRITRPDLAGLDAAPVEAQTARTDEAGPPTGLGPAHGDVQRAATDAGGGVEAPGDGGRVEPRRLSAPEPDERFVRRPAADHASRFTPEITRELERIREELVANEYTGRTWTWLEGKKTGNAAGGAADIVAGHGGAQVYNDILSYSPLNTVTSGARKGDVARGGKFGAEATRAKVLAAVTAALETQDVKNNLAEGAVRVAERRAANDYSIVSRPELPPHWGTVPTPAFVSDLEAAIDSHVDPESGDVSFDPSEFDQGPTPAQPSLMDTLDTGEQQPRLPGAEQVREQDLATPLFDVPFSLTAPESKTAKGKQTTLFQTRGTRPVTDEELTRLGFDTTRVLYHETHTENVSSIKAEGFDLTRPRARASDDQVPDGVFFKPDRSAIGVGGVDQKTATQLPVYFRAGKTLDVASRDELVAHLTRDPEYKHLLAEATQYDKAQSKVFGQKWDELRKLDADERGAHAAHVADLQLDAFLQVWKDGNAERAAAARARATEVLKAQGYETVHIAEDRGSFGRKTETFIAIGENQVVNADASAKRMLFQGARGKIRLGPGGQIDIELLTHADLSTFLHESGHFFLTVLNDLANAPDAAPGIKADMATLDAWLVDEDHTGTGSSTKQHEQFARGFEAYLMEGKAPSVELRPVFARFRAWLVGVYRSLRGLNVDLTPEVRQVFDRLLAGDDAIEQVQREGDVAPLFTTADSAGMTPEQFAAYRDLVGQAGERAKDDMQRALLRDVTRAQKAWWTTERDAMQAQVATELNDQPAYRALFAVQKGTTPAGESLLGEGTDPIPMKLSRQALVDQYGEGVLKELPKPYVYTREGGMLPDQVAEALGFSSGDELVQALRSAQPYKATLEAETDARMRQKFGDTLLDGSLHDQAEAAVYGAGREKVIQAELKALTAGLSKGVIPPAAVIRDRATARIAATKVRDLRPGLFLMAARRASQRAFDLLATHGDRMDAVSAKQDELVNLALYREAHDALETVDTTVEYLRSFDGRAKRERIGKAGGDYLDQIDGLRNRYELATVTNRTLDRRASLAQFVEQQTAQGHELAIPPALLAESRRTNYREATVEELRAVKDGVDTIAHWAQLKNKLLRNAAQRDLATLATDGATSIQEHAPSGAPPPIEPRKPGAQMRRNVQAFLLAHRPLQAILRQLDGFRDGFLYEHLWRPAHEARVAEQTTGQDAAARWRALHEARFAGRERSLYEATYIPAIGNSLSTAARIAVAFNWGNDGNRERLRSAGIGNSGPLTDTHVQAILDTLTPADWTYVRGVTDLIGSYKGQIADLYKRVTGVEPTWVEPASFHAAQGGEQSGWYYPIAYEGRASARALPGPDASFADILGKSAYLKYQTANGHTEARAAHTGIPLRADLGVVGEHLQQVIHDLTHREMLLDAGRLLGRKELQESIYRHYGDQTYREIQGAFRDLAIGPLPAPDWYRTVGSLRRGYTMARLAWNFATMVRHVTNITSGMVRVGAVDVIREIPRWIGSAKDQEASTGWIAEQSPLMAGRWTTRLEELNSIQTDIGLNRGKLASSIRDAVAQVGLNPDLAHRFADSYLYGIHRIIQLAEIPSWLAAYHKAIGAGRDHADAVTSADSAILDAFGGGQALDLAHVQRAYAGKLFTTFMSFGLSLHRLNYEILHKDASVGRKIVDATLLNTVPILFTSAVFNQVHNKQSFAWTVAEETFANALGMFVFLREVSGALVHADYSGPAALAPIGAISRVIYNTGRAIRTESSGKLKTAGKAGIELAAQLKGVPAYQIERTAEGLTALYEGRTHDLSVLFFGPPPKNRGRQ